MEAETHPDPFREAVNHGLQRAMQVASCAVTAAQVVAYQYKAQARASAERNDRARRALHAQIQADRDTARAGWAPALDPQWLRQASLHETAQTWGAATPYADPHAPWHEPTAGTAMHRSEDRLRDLHPFAMARYDRLRADGIGPADAMQEAAPLFALSPTARYWPFAPRPVLTAGTGTDESAADLSATDPEPDEPSSTEALELRGRSIGAALQERARAERREPLGEDELRTVLETITNLPSDIIRYVTRSAPADGPAVTDQSGVVPAERTQSPGRDGVGDPHVSHGRHERTGSLAKAQDAAATASTAADRVTQPWERDFPTPIKEVVAAAAASPTQKPRDAAASRPAVSQAARRGGPGHA